MTDLPNGFTGFSHRDPNFVSAGDALRGSRYDDTPFAARKQAQARNLAEAWSPAASERAGAGVAAEGGSDAAARGASRSLSQLSSAASDVLRFAEQGTQATGAPRFDPDKLARALGNVLRNAVAYADANSVIAIAARQDARTTTITVANRGREISDAHLETIFEKFYREDGARSSKKGGAGLGLAIAREIVVAHHGDIEAASERGVTVFTLRIPTQGEEIEGAAAAPRIPGAPEGLQRPVAPVPPRTARPAGVRAISPPPSATTRRGASARPNPQHPVGERTHAPRQGTSPLNPRNARHGQVPARKTVRDNDATPRRRGLSR